MTFSTPAADTAPSTAADQAGAEIAFQFIALDAIVQSKTNRTNFDKVKLDELAASIKSSGVHTPIIVRPLPASRLEETFSDRRKGATLPAFEIVAGERRYRASIIAGKTTIPAITRQMTDSEAVESQLIENVQREGLHPMEEAEGYERLIQFGEAAGGKKLTAEEIGAKVGRSRSYVFGKRKLLDLCAGAREAFYAGKLDESKALLIARIPTEKRQLAALKSLTTTDYYGQTMSYKAAAAHVQQHHMLKLGSAKFKITDASLIDGVPDCRSCPKRTGADKELYADVDGADVCTDPDCFGNKTEAHAAALRKQAEERGQVVIEGAAAKKVRPHSYGGIDGYLRIDEINDSPTQKPIRKLLGADMPEPILFIDPHDSSVSEVLPRDVVTKLLTSKGLIKKNDYVPGKSASSSEPSDAQIKARAEDKYQTTWRSGACEAVFAAALDQKIKTLGSPVMRLIAGHLTAGLNSDAMKRIAVIVDPENAAVGAHGAVDDFVRECPEATLPGLVMMILAQHDVRQYFGAQTTDGDAEKIIAVAAEVSVDLDMIRQAVKDEMKEKADEAKQRKAAKQAKEKAQATPKPAAKGKTPAKAGKLSADDAKAAIAKAMQAGDKGGDDKTGDLLAAAGDAGAFVINQAVRVVPTLGGKTEWSGRKGVVREISSTGIVSVRFKGRNAGLITFPPEQLTSIKEEA